MAASDRWVHAPLLVICEGERERERGEQGREEGKQADSLTRTRSASRLCLGDLQRGTGSRYIGEEAGKRRAALLCAAAEAFVPARKREYFCCSPPPFFLFFIFSSDDDSSSNSLRRHSNIIGVETPR